MYKRFIIKKLVHETRNATACIGILPGNKRRLDCVCLISWKSTDWRKFVQLLKLIWFGLGCLHGWSYMNKVICFVVIFRRGSEWGGGDQGESECSGD